MIYDSGKQRYVNVTIKEGVKEKLTALTARGHSLVREEEDRYQ